MTTDLRSTDDAAAPPPTVRSSRALVDDALAVVRTLDTDQALALHGDPAVRFVDLREDSERLAHGTIPGALHAPRGVLEFKVDPASAWHEPALAQPGTRLVLFCAIGWRSALAARTLQAMGLADVAHVGGGFTAWRDAGGAVAAVGAGRAVDGVEADAGGAIGSAGTAP